MSSMSGFVESVRITRQTFSQAAGARLAMQVTVSTTAIENYVQAIPGRTGVNINALFAESDRAAQALAFRDNFAFRLFAGYPYQAVQTRLISMGPSSNPENVNFTFENTLDERFIANVVAGAKRLSCPSQEPFDAACSSTSICWTEATKTWLGQPEENKVCTRLAVGVASKDVFRNDRPLQGLVKLEHGFLDLGSVVRFLRKDGSRIGSECYDLVFPDQGRLVDIRHSSGYGEGTIVTLHRSTSSITAIPRALISDRYVNESASVDAQSVLATEVSATPDKVGGNWYATQFDITDSTEGMLSRYVDGGHAIRPAFTPDYVESREQHTRTVRKMRFSPEACRWPS